MIFGVFSVIILFNKYEQFNIFDGIDFLYSKFLETYFVINKLHFHYFDLYSLHAYNCNELEPTKHILTAFCQALHVYEH